MSSRRSIKQKRQQKARRNRFLFLGAIVLIALAIVGALILNNARPVGEFTTITKQAYPMADGKSLGPVDAPVLVQEFSDYQCPFCREYFETIEKQLVQDFVDTGRIRYEYHHFIVIDGNVGGTESRHAAQASECAREQGDFWNYHAMLFTNQQGEGSGAYSDDRLKAFAEALGYDMNEFNACLNSSQAADAVKADESLAVSNGLNSTPSLLINGVPVENPLDYTAVKAAIDAALNQPN